MKVLLGTHHLLSPGGTETLTATVADFLQRRGEDVTIYCPWVDPSFVHRSQVQGRIVTSLRTIGGEAFDVAHVNHNLIAVEVRSSFPRLPLILVANGLVPFLEQTPPLDLGISLCLAISEEVRDYVLAANADLPLRVWRNPVDEGFFKPSRPAGKTARRALVLSYGITSERRLLIESVCAELGIECRFAGRGFRWVEPPDMPAEINDADIVFGAARRAVEAMLCGRTPFLFDNECSGGLVTPENFSDLMSHNFTGRARNLALDQATLIEELTRYNPSHSPKLRALAQQHFGATFKIAELVSIYEEVANRGAPSLHRVPVSTLDFIRRGLEETRKYRSRDRRELASESPAGRGESFTHAALDRILVLVDCLAPPRTRRGRAVRSLRRLARRRFAA